MTVKRIISLAISLLLFCPNPAAQRLTWDIDLHTVFDNREGSHDITPTETYFFTRLSPEIGLDFNRFGRIAGGVDWTQPIGNGWDDPHFSPTLYYRYESRPLDFSFGMFPRTQLREELPGFLWCDSLEYFQPNIRGALVQYQSEKGFVDFYLDWRQMQTRKKREAFNIVLHSQWNHSKGIFFAGGHAMMNHFALVKNAPADQHIVDNFLVNPYIGADLTPVVALDSLRLRGGAVITIERNRSNGGWKTPAGGWLEIYGKWRFLGLKNTLYAGGALLPSYHEFGSQLYQGEPFYSRRFYNRTDIYAYIISNRYVDLRASLDFNVSKGSFIFYQCLKLRVYVSNFFSKKTIKEET